MNAKDCNHSKLISEEGPGRERGDDYRRSGRARATGRHGQTNYKLQRLHMATAACVKDHCRGK